jgi:hypothetical protein
MTCIRGQQDLIAVEPLEGEGISYDSSHQALPAWRAG